MSAADFGLQRFGEPAPRLGQQVLDHGIPIRRRTAS
jgi:hypothetical protein